MGKRGVQHTHGRKPRRSRRELLAGAAGALGVVGAEVLAKAAPAQAGTDGDVVLGGVNYASTQTSIYNGIGASILGLYSTEELVDAGGVECLYAQSGTYAGTNPGGTKNAIHAVTNSPTDSALWGENVNGGYGLFGSTTTTGIGGGAGVAGLNNGSGPGVRGASQSGAGLYGAAPSGEGLYARSGNTDGTTPGTTRSGVHGVTNSLGAGAVWGEHVGGGDGVMGTSGVGNGLHGLATGSGGVGILADNTAGGTALKANGTSEFTGAATFDSLINAARSGVVVIPSGQTKATVTPTGGLSASALVLAVLQNVAGGVMVKAAVPNPGAGTFQIVLNKAPLSPATAKVAWFVVN